MISTIQIASGAGLSLDQNSISIDNVPPDQKQRPSKLPV
ncbi:hypothetical protein DSM3645_00105 [Blastopirellula marina DSM 3645]|uniref:Uncharacterized protein n=1 Tax=Blastopirellula marina DSM 3645 TaxID=314230 RepID=A3ZMA0_9BACT|nr:hypothetical protein DSM3645_00105 [Blastopirellula marina DSM 3645]